MSLRVFLSFRGEYFLFPFDNVCSIMFCKTFTKKSNSSLLWNEKHTFFIARRCFVKKRLSHSREEIHCCSFAKHYWTDGVKKGTNNNTSFGESNRQWTSGGLSWALGSSWLMFCPAMTDVLMRLTEIDDLAVLVDHCWKPLCGDHCVERSGQSTLWLEVLRKFQVWRYAKNWVLTLHLHYG